MEKHIESRKIAAFFIVPSSFPGSTNIEDI